MKKNKKDRRTLCYRCKSDYEEAGYKLYRTDNKFKDKCDKCFRDNGYEYILKNDK